MLKNTSLDRQAQIDIYPVGKFGPKKKKLFLDLDTIADPKLREFFPTEPERIMHKKKTEQHQQGFSSVINVYGQYFDDVGGSGTDLLEY